MNSSAPVVGGDPIERDNALWISSIEQLSKQSEDVPVILGRAVAWDLASAGPYMGPENFL